MDNTGLLVKLGGWRQDRSTGQEGLTVAGLIMFGNDEAIREAIPHYHVDYREKLSNDLGIRWTDRLTRDGTWTANLFQFYLRVIQRLSTDLKLPFQLDSNLFRKGETEVHEAIREALVNALIHADYQGIGGIIIIKHKDHFEFSNPGTLLVSFEQLLRGNVSECRNKTLQTMFMMIGAAEKAGSGIDKIRHGWSTQHWRSPWVRERMQPDRVCWHLPMISLIPEESLNQLQKKFGNQFQSFSRLEVQALVTADVEEYVDNARMRQITHSHSTDITRIFQGLVAKGALVQEGQARGTQYRLLSDMTIVSPNNDFPHKAAEFPHNSADFPHKESQFPHNEGLVNQLASIAEPARMKRRLAPQGMEQLILKLCADRWLSRRELSVLLNRNPDNLFRLLTPLVDRGLLVMKYPEKPNRVDQAYKSMQESMIENA